MLTDPWQLKHSIEQRQKQLYNKKLIEGRLSTDQKTSHQTQQILKHHIHQTSLTNTLQEQSQFHNDPDDNSMQKNQKLIPSLQTTHQSQSVSNNTIQFLQIQKNNLNRKKYGNIIVFIQIKNFLLSIGPNYCFFFFAYLAFTLATIYLVGLVNTSIESETFKIINFLFCWGQNLSYILVALSNPGIQLPEKDIILQEEDLKKSRFCKKCGAIQQKKTYHCRQCDVCINQYDHHCPWTSKCIGGGNLKRFYFFVCMTPFYIFYYMIVFMICMANLTAVHNSNIKPAQNPPTF